MDKSDYIDLPIIDAHVHMQALDGIDDMMRGLDECGFAAMNIVCIPGSRVGGLAENAVALLCKAMHPQRVYVSGGLCYGMPGGVSRQNLANQAGTLLDIGCDAMKMIEGKPGPRKRTGLALNDPAYDDYYALLERRQAPLTFHVADPEHWWDAELAPPMAREHGAYWEDPQILSQQALYDEALGVLEKFPNLRVIFAHFFFLSNYPDRAAAFLDRWPNVCFDLAPGAEMYRNFSKQPERWRELFTAYQDRIIFGTDNITPQQPREARYRKMIDKSWWQRRFLETRESFEGFGSVEFGGGRPIRGLGLDRPVLQKIYRDNYQRCAGPQPKAIDPDAVIDYTCHAIELVQAAHDDQAESLEELRQIHKRLEALAAA
jgi:hypothetical protein